MKKQKITLHSPIHVIDWPPRIAVLFAIKKMEVLFDIYYHEVRTHKTTSCYINGGLGQIAGFGRAAYRDVRSLLKKARLPDLKKAPQLLNQSDSIKIHELNEGSSSG